MSPVIGIDVYGDSVIYVTVLYLWVARGDIVICVRRGEIVIHLGGEQYIGLSRGGGGLGGGSHHPQPTLHDLHSILWSCPA